MSISVFGRAEKLGMAAKRREKAQKKRQFEQKETEVAE